MDKPGSTSVNLRGDMDDVFRLALQGMRERPEKTADRDVQMRRLGTTAYALVRNSVAGHSIQIPFSSSDIVIWSACAIASMFRNATFRFPRSMPLI